MYVLVTSAAGVNGNGYGALLEFDFDGRPLGRFSEDTRIADPRGLAIDDSAGLLFLNSGTNRILVLDENGNVVRDTGPIDGLNPGGGTFGPDRRFYAGSRDVYKSAFDLSDMSDAMDDRTAGSMVPRCVVDLKPGVCDAPLHGFGA